MDSKDIISLGIWQCCFITLRFYPEPLFGWRYLGKSRRALDLGYLSFIFEYI